MACDSSLCKKSLFSGIRLSAVRGLASGARPAFVTHPEVVRRPNERASVHGMDRRTISTEWLLKITGANAGGPRFSIQAVSAARIAQFRRPAAVQLTAPGNET